MSRFTVSIAGASGYTGLEAIRYLGMHPEISIKSLYGDSSAGRLISDIYPALGGICDLKITSISELAGETADAVLLGLPHGKSADAAEKLISAGYKGHIIDMGSDFRLRNAEDYKTWYGYDHAWPGLIPQFVYGLTEVNRSAIRNARHIANPGCFASALQLAIAPAVKGGLIEGAVHVTAITGSTGSGSAHSATTHFSTRFANMKAYKVFGHQHMAEVNQTMAGLSNNPPEVLFVPVSGPVTRGIWLTASFRLKSEVVSNFQSPPGGDESETRESGRSSRKSQVGPAGQQHYENLNLVKGRESDSDRDRDSGNSTKSLDAGHDDPLRPAISSEMSLKIERQTGQHMQKQRVQKRETQTGEIIHVYESFYNSSPLVRLRAGLPELKSVVGTAFTDIGIVQQGRNVVVGAAIDNLGKGAAGQAIQNLNLMLGLPEQTGLNLPPIIF